MIKLYSIDEISKGLEDTIAEVVNFDSEEDQIDFQIEVIGMLIEKLNK